MLNCFGKLHKSKFRLANICLVLCLAQSLYGQTKPISRTILALYKGSENRTEEVNEIYQMAQLVLNNLGLIVEYADAETELPDLKKSSQYRGILTWFVSGQMRNAANYRIWLNQIISELKKPVVILGHLGAYREYSLEMTNSDFKSVNKILSSFGLKSTLNSWQSENIRIIFKDDSIYDYETPILPEDLNYMQNTTSVDANNRVLLRLNDGNLFNDAAVVTPNGALIQDNIIYKQDISSGRVQWYFNPFKLFYQVFGCKSMPIIDINTLGGKRISFIHIDGDGFSTISKIDHWHLCAQIFQERIINKYPLPYSVSIIAAEVDSTYMGNEETINTARELFRMPNVEPASHGFAHPFNWRTGELELDSIPNFKFDPKIEINESIRYIQNNLLEPGELVELFFWTGMCNPTAGHLKIAKDSGLLQINGGVGRIDPNKPSITGFAPPYSQLKDQIRINARISNEFEFTNLWQGPYNGFIDVLKSIKFTDNMPVIPANIYFHLYSLEFQQSYEALREVIKYAAHQDWNFLYASQYIKLVQDFLQAEILQLNSNEFYIKSNGFVRTIRFPNESRKVDLISSENILGYTYLNNYLVVHLNHSTNHRIVLTEKTPEIVHFVTFNRIIDSYSTSSDTLMIKADGYGKFKTKLRMFHPNSIFKIQTITELNKEEYNNINYKTIKKIKRKIFSTSIVQSENNGSLEFETFIKNRTILLISSSNKLDYIVSKTKILFLGVVLVGFICFQSIWIRKRKSSQKF